MDLSVATVRKKDSRTRLYTRARHSTSRAQPRTCTPAKHGTCKHRETRVTTQHLRSCLCQNTCLVAQHPFSPAILVTGWWLVLCALFFCVFLHFEGSFAYLYVFPSVFAPLFLSFPVSVRCCGRASPLELLLMVFMSLRDK